MPSQKSGAINSDLLLQQTKRALFPADEKLQVGSAPSKARYVLNLVRARRQTTPVIEISYQPYFRTSPLGKRAIGELSTPRHAMTKAIPARRLAEERAMACLHSHNAAERDWFLSPFPIILCSD